MFQRLQERLGKTRDALIYRLDRLFLGKKEIDQTQPAQLEEILITADLGVTTTLELIDVARKVKARPSERSAGPEGHHPRPDPRLHRGHLQTSRPNWCCPKKGRS